MGLNNGQMSIRRSDIAYTVPTGFPDYHRCYRVKVLPWQFWRSARVFFCLIKNVLMVVASLFILLTFSVTGPRIGSRRFVLSGYRAILSWE